jgi:hypothetical protein
LESEIMAYFTSKPSACCLKKAVIASAILLISAQAQAESGSERSFLGLSGHWSGAGTVTMANGATERIRCKAAYAVNATGKAVQQTLRCASDSYRVEISSNASGAEIVANVAGAGFTADRIEGWRPQPGKRGP